nr:hypothetical protein [uncultured Prevotella sp.]
MTLKPKFIVPAGMLRNLGIGVGLNDVSERKGQVGRRENVVSYPGYGLLNLALYYKVRDIDFFYKRQIINRLNCLSI